MLSKILIDIDSGGESVIRISNLDAAGGSEDVRDKLVGRFLGAVSGRCGLIHFNENGHGDVVLKASSLETVLNRLLLSLTDPVSKKMVEDLISREFGGVNTCISAE